MELQGSHGILDPLTDREKAAILSTFFDDVNGLHGCKPSFHGPYFTYYERELKRLRLGIPSSRVVTGLAVKSQGDILAICDILALRRHAPRSAVRDEIKSLFPGADDLSVSRSVDLVIRLWLMLNCQDDQMSLLRPQKSFLQWEDDQTFAEFVGQQFPLSTTKLGVRERRLSPAFTVSTMVRLCNLKLEWTDSIESHLRLDRLSKTLWVFPFKDFLVAHLNLSKSIGNQPIRILPPALLRETITTLNMLFPQWHSETQSLLSKHGQTFHSVGPFHEPGRLDLYEFEYWRDQLLELHEEIYLAPADSWRQLWIDRRNPHQYYTFWIALVVFILSICSLIASMIQAWASVKSLNLQLAGGGGG